MNQSDSNTNPEERLPITSEMRLSVRQWAIVVAMVALVVIETPWLWKQVERFDIAPDYRIPYQLSNDYWLFDWRLQKTSDARPIMVLGDSVVWGEYVKSDGTLPHFLNRESGQPDRFVNAGVNGLFPLALEGLVRYYGTSLHDRKVIVVCNLLWLSSPKADMQLSKPQNINHATLIPQFYPQIACYEADVNQRLSAVIERNVDFMGWVNHLQSCCFHQQSIPKWTLEEDAERPRQYPNSYKNPFAQITLAVPSGEGDDAERGPDSPRHKPWTDGGGRKQSFQWVEIASSRQWPAFQRTVELLRSRGNDVMVIVTPFNRHMIADKSVAGYTAIHAGVVKWLSDSGVPYVAPDVLPSDLYADASHPLTAGYELLAKTVYQTEAFGKWMDEKK